MWGKETCTKARRTNAKRTSAPRRSMESKRPFKSSGRAINKMIAADTMKILADKKYLNDQEAEVDLSASLEFAINNTVLYDGGTCGKFQTRHDTKIEVTSETTIEALTRISSEEKKAKTAVRRTKNESEQNKKPTVEQGKEDEGEQRGVESRFSIKHSSDGKALGTEELENGSDNDDDSVDIFVLNFASGRNPGGGFLRGAQAQEESIAKVSGLYPCLETQHESFYMPNRRSHSPFYTDNVIYSPKVPVFRRDNGDLLDTPILASIASCAAVNAGVARRAARRQGGNLESEIVAANTKRMRLVLRVAAMHKHDVLILGAIGCGVFRNNPSDIARIWKKLLTTDTDLVGRFRRICFAVYDTTKDKNVLRSFRLALSGHKG